LLSPAELSSILRVPGIENTGSVRTTLDHTGDNVQPPNCLALAAVAQDRVYERGRHTGLRTSDFTDGKPAGVSRWGTQAVVSFPNVENATAFYKESAKEWERCGRAFTTQWGTPDQNRDERTVWLINDARRILSTKFTALYVHCGRALAMRHNVVGDVIVCRRPTSDDLSTDDEALAVDVAQQISDKMS
ncbi:MAG: sensor domain-containing protein, partial [Mycobacterium sp.]